MTRFLRLAVALVVTLVFVLCGSPAAADQGPATARGGVAVRATCGTQYLTVPGYPILAQKHVQKEIGLTEEQKAKLEAICKDYYKEIRQGYQKQAAIKWHELSEEERKKKLQEVIEEGPRFHLPEDDEERYQAVWKQKRYKALSHEPFFETIHKRIKQITNVDVKLGPAIGDVITQLAESELVGDKSVVVVTHSTLLPFQSNYGSLELLKEHRHGDSCIAVFRKGGTL